MHDEYESDKENKVIVPDHNKIKAHTKTEPSGSPAYNKESM
jgi:hypothetical protein